MKPVLPQVWKPCRLLVLVATTAMVLMLATVAPAQDSQFFFDDTGNLTVQTTVALAPPQILGQPQPQVVMPGALVSFSVVAANTHNLVYQWLFNGTNVSGVGITGTAETLVLQFVGATNEGQYSVVLSNSSGSVTSAPAALWLDSDRDSLPDSWEQTYFGGLGQNPAGDFDGDGVSNRDEWLDGTNPADSASVLFRLTVISDGGNVVVNPGRFTFTNGEIVMLTATVFPPNTFHGWTGDTNTLSPAISLAMTTNKTVFAHLATYDMTWTNPASGDWNVASNWSPNLVPGTNDNVTLPKNVTVTLNNSTACGSFTLGAGTLTGSGDLTLHRNSSWTGGTMSGSGRTIVAPGVTLTLPNVASTTSLSSGRTLENGGTIVWTGGNFGMNNAFITNRADALFEAGTVAGLNYASTPGSRFDNVGTFRKSVSAGTLNLFSGLAFNNSGAVEIQSGTLALFGGGAHTGTFDVPAGTTLNLAGGSHNASLGSSITGAGQLIVKVTAATLAGLVNVSGTNLFDGGTANLTGDYFCTNNTLVISGGTANFNGSGTVAPAVVIMDSGTLGGVQTVTVLNQMNWTGGTMTGSGRTIIPAGVLLNIAPVSSIVALSGGRTLENGGTILWTAGNFGMNNAVITNRAGALFEAQTATGLNYAFNPGSRLDNAGTFRKTVSAGTMSVFAGMAFNNYNTVEIEAGMLALSGGGTHTGMFEVPAGTTLGLSGGAHTASAGSSITGEGNLTVTGGATATLSGFVHVRGTNTFSSSSTANLTGNCICTNNTMVIASATANFNGTGTVAPAVLSLSGGTLGGSQTVTVLGGMNWTGGTMTGSGRTIIPPGVTLNIAPVGTTISLTAGRTLENGGIILWTAGNFAMNGAVITNRAGALFEARTATGLNYTSNPGSRFDNAGTFRKSISTGTTTVFGGMAFNNYNILEIQTGILAANGGYISTANSLLHCALGGTTVGSGYGQLKKTGTITLNGALSVSLTNGFVPTTNDIFDVVTAGTRSGMFANFSYPSNTVTMQVSNTANSVIVSVSEVLALPQPILHIERIELAAARLYWSTNYPDFHLEFNTSLSTSNWAESGLAPVVTGTNFVVTNSLFGAQKYYRLSRVPATYTPPPPALGIEHVAPGSVRLFWSAEDDRTFTLQSNTNLSLTNWASVLPPPAILGWNNTITNTITGVQKFYRLVRP